MKRGRPRRARWSAKALGLTGGDPPRLVHGPRSRYQVAGHTSEPFGDLMSWEEGPGIFGQMWSSIALLEFFSVFYLFIFLRFLQL